MENRMGAFFTLPLLQLWGKIKGNQFRSLLALPYYSIKKESGSRNIKIYIKSFSVLL
jgi:hypothetical protein